MDVLGARRDYEDDFAALGGETKIGCSNGQRLLDRAFDTFSGWQWIRRQERIIESVAK